MKWVLTIMVAMVSLTSGRSQLATFEFTGSFQNTTRNTPTSVAAGADSTSFDLVNLATKNINNTTDNNWVVQNWNQGSSIDSTEYAYFRISAESGFLLNLTQLNFQSSQGIVAGPDNAQVSLFINGSSTASASYAYSPTLDASIPFPAFSWDFIDIQDATSAEFRFYGWNASAAEGSLRYDQITAGGSVTPVPEPYEYGLIAVTGLLGYGIFNRRQAKKVNQV